MSMRRIPSKIIFKVTLNEMCLLLNKLIVGPVGHVE